LLAAYKYPPESYIQVARAFLILFNRHITSSKATIIVEEFNKFITAKDFKRKLMTYDLHRMNTQMSKMLAEVTQGEFFKDDKCAKISPFLLLISKYVKSCQKWF
jgi:N-glycosylase/DNA lyase